MYVTRSNKKFLSLHDALEQQEAEENNKKIANLLAKTDIVKNSLADPIGQEKRINEQVNKLFTGINTVTK